MKNLFLVFSLSASLLSSAALASGDMMVDTIKCQPQEIHPDLGMSLVVSEGGLAGIPQIYITRYFIGYSSNETYLARVQPPEPRRLGAPVVYKGNGISLSINFTTSLLEDGGHLGFLTLQKPGQEAMTERLSCKRAQ